MNVCLLCGFPDLPPNEGKRGIPTVHQICMKGENLTPA